jgi:hypothetical protein
VTLAAFERDSYVPTACARDSKGLSQVLQQNWKMRVVPLFYRLQERCVKKIHEWEQRLEKFNGTERDKSDTQQSASIIRKMAPPAFK